MAPSLTLYHDAPTRSTRALWTIYELDLPVTIIPKQFKFNSTQDVLQVHCKALQTFFFAIFKQETSQGGLLCTTKIWVILTIIWSIETLAMCISNIHTEAG